MASAPEKAFRDVNDSLRDLLECPICLDYCKTPIFMCVNGHHVCNVCQTSLFRCPTCRVYGQPKTRCPVLEKMADKLKMPCANKHEGCNEVLNAAEMAKHWESCKIKYSYDCKIITQSEPTVVKCEWEGDRQALVAHVKKDHPGCYSEDEIVQNDVAINFKERIDYDRLISAHNELFWVKLKFQKEITYLYSKYIGQKEDASSYFGKFVCSSADGFIEQTTFIQTDHGTRSLDTTPYALRLPKMSAQQFMSKNIFSFTSQIRKK